jgi:hypothetical protein
MRPQLSKSADEALPISKDFGLNKNLSGTKKLGTTASSRSSRRRISQAVVLPLRLDPRMGDRGPGARPAGRLARQDDRDNYDSAGHPLVGCACGTTGIPGALRDLEATLTVVNTQQSFKFNGGDEMEKAMGALYTSTPGIYGALSIRPSRPRADTVAQLKTSAASYTPKASTRTTCGSPSHPRTSSGRAGSSRRN